MSDFTLYKVSQKFESLMDLIDRDVLEEWEAEELKKVVAEEIKANSKDIVRFYINEMADIESLKNEIKRLQIIKSSKEARVERFKDKLTENMRSLSVKKIATPLGNITLALDGVNKTIELKEGADINNIPEEYLRISKELRKTELKKALEDGMTFDEVEIKETPARVRFMLSQEAKDYQSEKAGE